MNGKHYKLRFLPLFEDDLSGIVDYIAYRLKNPIAADQLVDAVQEAIRERTTCAEAFEPLSKAYGMPKETEEQKAEKARVMAIVLKDACAVPMEIMEKCCEAIDVIEEFAAKGSALAISDAGVGVVFCKAALLGASLNVYINTKSMADKEYAASLNEKADKMIADYSKKADEIFAAVNARLR